MDNITVTKKNNKFYVEFIDGDVYSCTVKEINKLKASIERREKLLANSNYVSKAPANIVEADRKKLLEEKEKLAILENK